MDFVFVALHLYDVVFFVVVILCVNVFFVFFFFVLILLLEAIPVELSIKHVESYHFGVWFD